MNNKFSTKQLIFKYLDHLEVGKNRSKRTILNYRHYLGRFVQWCREEKPENITTDIILDFCSYLHKELKVSRSTQNYHLIALRGFLAFLQKIDVESLPPNKVEIGKIEKKEVEFLKNEEIKFKVESTYFRWTK